jgi:ubiquinol-cytochrome c reductase cytochrome c1 subunit
VFPNVGMPHVLWELQGEREPVYDQARTARPRGEVFKGWKQLSPGTLTPLQYDQAVGDLVGYLQWMAEPAQNHRVRVGAWVLLFLAVLTVRVAPERGVLERRQIDRTRSAGRTRGLVWSGLLNAPTLFGF